MAKSKHARPTEHFLGTIRSLKKENNQLRKRIKYLENLAGPETKEEQPKRTKVKDNICPECAKGTLTETEFAGRIFDICYLCKYRSKVKRALKRK